MNRIKFIDSVHKYFKGDLEYISVTTLKGKYVPKFEGKYWSLYHGFRRHLGLEKNEFSNYLWQNFRFNKMSLNYEKLSSIAETFGEEPFEYAKQILAEWDDYRDYRGYLGTNYHKEKELKAYQQGFDIIDGKKGITQGVYSYDLSELKDGFYSELLVYLDDLYFNDTLFLAGVAGQVDKSLIETIGDTRWVDIDDYKTCAKISTTNKFNKLLYPLNQLEDCDLMKFAVQLNLYGMIFEQYGFKIRKLQFTHCVIDEETERCVEEIPYKIPIMTELMKELVYDWRKKNPLGQKVIKSVANTEINKNGWL